MKKKMVLLLCSAMMAVSLIGCGQSADATVKEQNRTEYSSEIENAKKETEKQETESEETKEAFRTIFPLATDIDMNQLENCIVAVSFEDGDVYVDDTGALQIHVKVYTYDMYDMVDISLLEEGDVLRMNQQEVLVETLERTETGLVFINGGLDNGGYELITTDNGTYFETGYSDKKSYYEVGEVTIRVSPDFVFTDSSDLDKGEVTYYPGDFLTSDAGILYHFIPDNTSILIEDGMVTAMYRVYMP